MTMKHDNVGALKYYPKSHRYVLKGKELTSVTSFVGKFFAPFNEREVARKLAKIPSNKASKKGVRYFLKQWAESQNKGHQVHKEMENFFDRHQPTTTEEGLSAYLGYTLLVSDLINRGVQDIQAYPEVIVYNEELGLAGTIDLLIAYKTNQGEQYSIIDWKTCDKITTTGYKGARGTLPPTSHLDDCKLNKYGLQLGAYALIMEKNGFVVNDLVLVHTTTPHPTNHIINSSEVKKTVESMVAYEKETQNTINNNCGDVFIGDVYVNNEQQQQPVNSDDGCSLCINDCGCKQR